MPLVTQIQPSSVSLLGSAPDFLISGPTIVFNPTVFSSQTGTVINTTVIQYDPQQLATYTIGIASWSASGAYLALTHSTLAPRYSIWKRTGCRLDLVTTVPAFVGTECKSAKPLWMDNDNLLFFQSNDVSDNVFALTRSGDTFTRITGVLDFNPASLPQNWFVNPANDILVICHNSVGGPNHNTTIYKRTPATNNFVRSQQLLYVSTAYSSTYGAFNPARPHECIIAYYIGSGSDRRHYTTWTESAGVLTALNAGNIGFAATSTQGNTGDVIYHTSGKFVYACTGTGVAGVSFQAFDPNNSYAAVTHGVPSNRLHDRLTIGSNPDWMLASGASTAVNDYMSLYSINTSTGALTTLDRFEIPGSGSSVLAPGANFAYGSSFVDQVSLLYNGDPLVTADGIASELRFNITTGTTAYNAGVSNNNLLTLSGTGYTINVAGPTGGTEGPLGLNRAFTFSGTVANADKVITQGGATWQVAGSGINTGAAFMVVKPSTPVGTKGTLWSQGQNTGTNKGLLALNVYSSNGELEVMARAGNTLGERARRFTGFNIADGNWHFIAVTQLGDGTGVHLWVDGVEKTSFTDTTSGTVPSVNHWFPTTIGASNIGTIMYTADITALPNHEGKGTVTYFGVVNTTNTAKLGSTYIKTLDAQLTF